MTPASPKSMRWAIGLALGGALLPLAFGAYVPSVDLPGHGAIASVIVQLAGAGGPAPCHDMAGPGGPEEPFSCDHVAQLEQIGSIAFEIMECFGGDKGLFFALTAAMHVALSGLAWALFGLIWPCLALILFSILF